MTRDTEQRQFCAQCSCFVGMCGLIPPHPHLICGYVRTHSAAPTHNSRVWRNWQTRWIQVPVTSRSYRFKSCYPHQIRNSRLIQSYRPTVFLLSLKISRKSLICKGFFTLVVHFGICGAYILCLGFPKMQKSTTPRQGVVPSYR